MSRFVSEPLVLLVAACEAGFWVVLGAGLVARYLLRLRRVSTALLLGVPALDVVLVVASLVDVARGSPPGVSHGLAGVYLGFTVAFGHPTVRWVDVRFAHRFAGGPPPPRPPRYGPAKVAYEWRSWGRAVLAWAVALAVLLLVSAVAGTGVPSPVRWPADPLWNWGARTTLVLAVWFVGWPLWTTVFPPRAPEAVGARR